MLLKFRQCLLVVVFAAKHIVSGLILDTTSEVIKGREVSSYTSIIPAVSLIKCESTCVLSKRNGVCNICGYDKVSRTCYLSGDNEDDIIPTSDDKKVVLKPSEAVCESPEYLVKGPDNLTYAQVSASSVYYNYPDHDTRGARLNSVPSETTIGAWIPWTLDEYQYIQVQFNGLSRVVGVAVQGRPFNTDPTVAYMDCCYHRVTSYKFLYSWDCQHFTTVKDPNGSDMIFAGNTDQDTVVTSMLPKQVSAVCVRINPVTWEGFIALRFDILGCQVN